MDKTRPVPKHSTPQRSLLIDTVRGMAICLVVLGHTNQGIAHRGWWESSSGGEMLQAFLYAFHMPAFFFVSGIFLAKSVETRGQLHFVLNKLRTILYPYILWTCIYLLASLLFSRFMVQAIPSWRTFTYNLLTGYGGWFLPALFFCLMLGMLGLKLPRPLLLLLSVLALVFLPVSSVSFVDRGVRELPFLTLGMWLGPARGRIERLSKSVALACYVVLSSTELLLALWLRTDVPAAFLLLGVLGTVMLLMLARVIDGSASARGFAWIGEASFGVFLMAPFAQGATRALLQALHSTRAYPQLIVPTLFAVLLPAWLYHRRARLRLGWLFVSPW